MNHPEVSTFTKVVEDIELKGKSWPKLVVILGKYFFVLSTLAMKTMPQQKERKKLWNTLSAKQRKQTKQPGCK